MALQNKKLKEIAEKWIDSPFLQQFLKIGTGYQKKLDSYSKVKQLKENGGLYEKLGRN